MSTELPAILGGCGLLLLLILVSALTLPRRQEEKQKPRRGLGLALVILLYRWARLWTCVAVAADKAVLHFHLERQRRPIEPEARYAEAR